MAELGGLANCHTRYRYLAPRNLATMSLGGARIVAQTDHWVTERLELAKARFTAEALTPGLPGTKPGWTNSTPRQTVSLDLGWPHREQWP